jgi:hypothetical protein
MNPLMAELERRWGEQFRALQRGDDLPPGRRLRTEGLMEAAVLAGFAGPQQVIAAMDTVYRAVFGAGLAQDFGTDWQEFWPFPQIPAVQRRAPVWPSAPD